LRERAEEMRSGLAAKGMHARVPGALAELQAGWEMFIQYGVEVGVGALGNREKEELAGRAARRRRSHLFISSAAGLAPVWPQSQ
jgi:hypothetical protein